MVTLNPLKTCVEGLHGFSSSLNRDKLLAQTFMPEALSFLFPAYLVWDGKKFGTNAAWAFIQNNKTSVIMKAHVEGLCR